MVNETLHQATLRLLDGLVAAIAVEVVGGHLARGLLSLGLGLRLLGRSGLGSRSCLLLLLGDFRFDLLLGLRHGRLWLGLCLYLVQRGLRRILDGCLLIRLDILLEELGSLSRLLGRCLMQTVLSLNELMRSSRERVSIASLKGIEGLLGEGLHLGALLRIVDSARLALERLKSLLGELFDGLFTVSLLGRGSFLGLLGIGRSSSLSVLSIFLLIGLLGGSLGSGILSFLLSGGLSFILLDLLRLFGLLGLDFLRSSSLRLVPGLDNFSDSETMLRLELFFILRLRGVAGEGRSLVGIGGVR